MGSRRPTIVVLGMATRMAVAGPVWMTMSYVLGLERLGYEVAYVEAHARTPTTLERTEYDGSSALAVSFIRRMLGRFGFRGRWAFHALHDDGRCYGMSVDELNRLYRSAELILNLHGGTPTPEGVANDRLVLLETDPLELQVQVARGDARTLEFLKPHAAYFTFAENYGSPEYGLPVTDRFRFRPTRQPVLLDLWARPGAPAGDSFRTVGNWRLHRRQLEFAGEVYTSSKHHEFLKFLDLPRVTGRRLEPALAAVDEADARLLLEHGWSMRDALAFADDTDEYRAFIHGARAEFTVAKDETVRLRSGSFSDRSACFLASGLPVVAQDTGFGRVLPTGEGLFSVRSLEEAADAVERVSADPARHGRAALEIAREYFSHDIVLGRLLSELGLPARVGAAKPARTEAARAVLPPWLSVVPVSKHPTELDAATVETILRRPVPPGNGHRANGAGPPAASVVVVTHDGLPFTRMALESVLLTGGPSAELIVIDNASGEDTRAYLRALRARHSAVRVVFNDESRSFAAAVNRGIELATGRMLVILSNDTIVTPGWLEGLARYLDDPAVGLVGPVTNEAGNEARVEAGYRTYGELLEFARARGDERHGQAFDIPVATMFCAATTRDVFARIGPLDERYAVGLFDGDDYSLRIRSAGLRVVCAEDVFVHHFGQGLPGALFPQGDYSALFEANRRRFEQKWGREWQRHSPRASDAWEELVSDVHALVARVLPEDAVVLVVSRGDDAFVEMSPRTGWHFPCEENGEHTGYYPADSAEAVERLERLRARGATHLLFPGTELWWLDHYEGLREHLRAHYREAAATPACVVFDLVGPSATVAAASRERAPLRRVAPPDP